MPECGACESYVPKLIEKANILKKKEGIPFEDYKSGIKLKTNSIPILVYDVASEDESIQALANRFNIEATPTTIVLVNPSGAFRTEGELEPTQIEKLLRGAAFYNK